MGSRSGDSLRGVPTTSHNRQARHDRYRAADRKREGALALHDVAGRVRSGTESPYGLDGGHRVPVVLFLSEDFYWCATAGDRTIQRYRAVAARKLGPSCPLGIVPPDKDELEATLADWCNEVERVQLMLRLTPRLREKYKD